MATRDVLRLRAITPPPGRMVALARPPYVSEAGKARIEKRDAAYEAARPRRKPYDGSRWSHDIYALARVDARAEKLRRVRRRVWFTRPDEKPFRLGLDRILPRAIQGLAAISGAQR